MTKRNFDPAWLTAPQFQNLSPLAEVLMYRAYNAADGMGRLAERTLRATLFPTGVAFEPDQWHKAMLELEHAGIWASYQSTKEPVLQLMSWHQPAGRSKFDDPPADLASRVERKAPRAALPVELVTGIDEVVVWMPVTGNTKAAIRESVMPAWVEAFPAIDVRQELKKMVGWCISNPSLVKTPSGVHRFIFTWLGKAQNDAARNSPGLGGSGKHVSRGHLGAAKSAIYG
jgi:hypothetical protein